MTLEEKNKILFDAFKKACEYMCKYPPAEIPSGEFEDIVWKAMLGSGVDKNGAFNYMAYFIEKVKEGDDKNDYV